MTAPAPETQICNSCGLPKPLDHFRIRKHGPMCMSCYNRRVKSVRRGEALPAKFAKEVKPWITEKTLEEQMIKAIRQIDYLLRRADARANAKLRQAMLRKKAEAVQNANRA